MSENISKQFVEKKTKSSSDSIAAPISHAMITVQEKMEVMQNSSSLSSDYYAEYIVNWMVAGSRLSGAIIDFFSLSCIFSNMFFS